MKYTPENISTLKENEFFVFGSNLAGKHGSGAARFAMTNFDAEWGVGDGFTGKCYAIPTMQGGISTIVPYVEKFLKLATKHTDKTFYVTKIGCGVAGFTPRDIAPLFKQAISINNVILPKEFVDEINNIKSNDYMDENIRIKCPICGTVLTVKNMLGIENKKIPCPICKTTSKFTDFKSPSTRPVVSNDTEGTEYGETEFNAATKPVNLKNYVIGKLQLFGSSAKYSLILGKNTIGRKANTSTASVQIETSDKTMSRLHSVIEVVKLTNGGYKHYLYNANNKNATYINNDKVDLDDRLVLNGGETIKMGNVVLKFTIPGGEETEY